MENENQNQNDQQNQNQNNEGKETITITQAELDKKIQSAEDRVRTQYSKQVKDLEDQVKKLTPVEKTESEKALESRLAALEAREKEATRKENHFKMVDALKAKNIPGELADYLKADTKIDDFATAYNGFIETAIKAAAKTNGYVPDSHKSGDPITKEDFQKMNMIEKEKLFANNPDLYRSLAKG